MSCININSKEFKALTNQTSISPTVLAGLIGAYMKRTGTEVFPTIEELLGNSKKVLKDRILSEEFTAIQELNNSDYNELERLGLLKNGAIIDYKPEITPKGGDLKIKAEKLASMLDAKVIVDNTMDVAGKLLASNHPLALKYGKPVIAVNESRMFKDTIEHEFAHLIVELLPEGPLRTELYSFVESTDAFRTITETYSELSKEEQLKETAASLLGANLAQKMDYSLERITTFRRIINKIAEFFSGIFNVSKESIIDKLSKDFRKDTLKLNPVDRYNSTIDKNQKYEIDPADVTNQKKVVDFLKHMNDSLSLDAESHEYSDKEGNVYNQSVTSKLESLKVNRWSINRRGSYSVKYESDLMTEPFVKRMLTFKHKIPHVYDYVLDIMFKEATDVTINTKVPNNVSWSKHYSELPDNEKAIMRVDIMENLDWLNESAEYEHKRSLVAAESGTYVHALIEDFINGKIDTFPPNIEGGDAIVKELKAIKSKADKAGSVLMTETTIFGETSKTPGQIDLIEITKDGKFRIYDVKTVNKRSFDSSEKSDYGVVHNYMAQQMAYSTILSNYGLVEVDHNPMNVILIGLDRWEFDVEDKLLTVRGVKTVPMGKESYNARKYYSDHAATITTKFLDQDKLKDYKLESLEDKFNRINEEVETVIKHYSELTGIMNPDQAKFKYPSEYNSEFYKLNTRLEKLRADKEAVDDLYIINSFVDAFIDTAAFINEMKVLNPGEAIDKNLLANFQYFNSLGDTINTLYAFSQETIDDSSLKLGIDPSELYNKLAQAVTMYNTFKESYEDKQVAYTATFLADYSIRSEAIAKEVLELEARQKGINDKEGIDNYIIQQMSIPLNVNRRRAQEVAYWQGQFKNGMYDLIWFDRYIADPGINKSLLVQTLKTVMDKADASIRASIDEVMPDIVKWEKSVEQKGTLKDTYKPIIMKVDDGSLSTRYMVEGKYDPEVMEHFKDINSRYLITEFTSDSFKAEMAYRLHMDYYSDQLNRLERAKVSESRDKKIKEYTEKKTKLQEARATRLQKISKSDVAKRNAFYKKRPNPLYEKLTKEQKDILKYTTDSIESQEQQIAGDVPFAMTLVIKENASTSKNGMKVSDEIMLYRLPAVAANPFENGMDPLALGKVKLEEYKNNFRPTGDDTDFDYNNLGVQPTDLDNRELMNVPLFYRRNLSDPSMQSYDIPTMLALNLEAVQRYKAYRELEADTHIILNATRDVKILSRDTISSKFLKSSSNGKGVVSNSNAILDTITNNLKSRMYSKRVNGINSLASYRTMKGLDMLRSTASDLFLILNYNSAINTAVQGTIYRFIEGVGGENFTKKDVTAGSKKALAEYHKVLKDIMLNQYPESKTMLMVRKFGLEADYHALARKFVDKGLYKALDKGNLYGFTQASEHLVTASLMYSVMNNIKVMNGNKEYIDENGKVVTKDKAMTLDEAYTVEDGRLVLNKHVVYTSNSLSSKYKDGTMGDQTNEALRVGTFISGLYKDLYGQYDKKLKSNLEMGILGDSIMHLRKWAPRGMNNRFRGATSTIGMTFKERRLEENIDRRFISQDKGAFKEGYVITTIAYVKSYMRELKETKNLMLAHAAVKEQMTTHERANVKRTIAELLLIGFLTAAVALLARLAYMDDDDNDEATWFLVYTMQRIKEEATFFYDPRSTWDIVTNPIISISALDRVYKFMSQAFGYEYNYRKGEYDWNFNDLYTSGSKKGDLKVIEKAKGIIPGYAQMESLAGAFGLNDGKAFQDKAEFKLKN